MKHIVMRDAANGFDSKNVLTQVVSAGGRNGLNAGEMRKRIKLLDRIDAANGDVLELEDAEHDTLMAIVNAHAFPMVNRALMQIIDDVNTPIVVTQQVAEAESHLR